MKEVEIHTKYGVHGRKRHAYKILVGDGDLSVIEVCEYNTGGNIRPNIPYDRCVQPVYYHNVVL
jgi:hypothetical protein